MKLRWLWLLFILLPLSVASAARANCRSDRDGITYCVEDQGGTHVLIVDLTNPRLRVQTAMANDVLDVWPSEEQRERVVDMAKRYRDEGVVIAVNGDYFGAGRGPEGPAVVQGQRLDTAETIAANPSDYRRSTLALSRSGKAAVIHLAPIDFLDPAAYRDVLFNTVSGGPIILLNGQPLPEELSCLIDNIPVNACRRDRQTVAGVDEQGTTLYLAVSTQRTTRGLAELLRDYGAFNALKLDGGGSSQLWYRGRTLVKSDRDVANALLVLAEDRPRHAAQLLKRPSVQLLNAGALITIDVPLRNTGHLAWTVDRWYGLGRIAGSIGTASFVRLMSDVPSKADATLTVPIEIAGPPGIYTSTWRPLHPVEEFGPMVPINAVVLPPDAAALRKQIQPLLTQLTRLSDKSFEREWPRTAKRIQQLLDKWMKEHP
jgi:exopolysaccharide biosynthesis protein